MYSYTHTHILHLFVKQACTASCRVMSCGMLCFQAQTLLWEDEDGDGEIGVWTSGPKKTTSDFKVIDPPWSMATGSSFKVVWCMMCGSQIDFISMNVSDSAVCLNFWNDTTRILIVWCLVLWQRFRKSGFKIHDFWELFCEETICIFISFHYISPYLLLTHEICSTAKGLTCNTSHGICGIWA